MKFVSRTLGSLILVMLVSTLFPTLASASTQGQSPGIDARSRTTQVYNFTGAESAQITIDVAPQMHPFSAVIEESRPARVAASDSEITRPRRVDVNPQARTGTDADLPESGERSRPPTNGQAGVLKRTRHAVKQMFNSLHQTLDWRGIVGLR